MQVLRESLPIFEYKHDLLEAIKEYSCLVVVGDTGSGKTTQLPQYLLETTRDRIVVTQPRRIAAISAARRVAQEQNKTVGKEIGYGIRFEKCFNEATQLVYMTDGLLLRECLSDPTLEKFNVFILDEAHERSLETDILFGLLKTALRRRLEKGDMSMKIIIMSATLDVDKFSDILWQKKMKMAALKASFVSRSVHTALHIHKHEDEGDVLVFLTGQHEIDQACKQLLALHKELEYPQDVQHYPTIKNMSIFPIYSSLETLEQKAIFEPAPPGTRKVIFATNIAQTSVTIPGIRYVVDSGFVKQKMYDPTTSMDGLMTVPVSQSAATQRAGRAGRTAPGKVFRLYSQEAFEEMAPDTLPEIQRASLIGTVLALKKMGIRDILSFDFIDRPDEEWVLNALKELWMLGALDKQGDLTTMGRHMSDIPVSPYLSRCLIESATVRPLCSDTLLTLVALLSVQDVFVSPRSEDKKQQAEATWQMFYSFTSDHLTLLNVYDQWVTACTTDEDNGRDWCRRHFLHHRSLKTAKSIRDQLSTVLHQLNLPLTNDPTGNSHDTAVLKCLCAGYFMHTALKQHNKPFYHLMASSRLPLYSNHSHVTLFLSPSSVLYSAVKEGVASRRVETLVYHDIQYIHRANMKCISCIQLDWVEPHFSRMATELQDSDLFLHQYRVTESTLDTSASTVNQGDSSIQSDLPSSEDSVDTPVEIKVDEAAAAQAEREEKERLARERYLKRKRK